MASAVARAQVTSVVPRPAKLVEHAGSFTITRQTVIHADDASAGVARQLARSLEPAMGFRLAVQVGAGSHATGIVLRNDTKLKRLGAEGYALDATTKRVLMRATAPAGMFYATQTLRQLLPPDVFRDAPEGVTRWTVPAVSIEDAPRFSWRGAHLDVSRHFMPKAFVEKYIDLLALHKMNTFHWHLTDDQGWRIEIMKYPRLTSVGAWRSGTLVGKPKSDSTKNVFDGVRHGGFYTQADIREVVAFAAERHVTIVPEIEMPGHARAAIAAYPWLGVGGDTIGVWGMWGVTDHILAPTDSAVSFMQDVLTEVLALFPGPFIHVGGDEAFKDRWKTDSVVQRRIRELGLKDEHEMQSWFIRQMDTWLAARGRRLVGWDEILEGGLAPGATVMSWRGTKGGIEAARAGHDVVMAPQRPTYFDHSQTRDRAAEGTTIGGFNPIDSVYAFEPVPAELDSIAAKHVLGAQSQMWTEYVPDARRAEQMVFPRLSALSEVLWTPAAQRDFSDFTRRMATHEARLQALDVNYWRPPLIP